MSTYQDTLARLHAQMQNHSDMALDYWRELQHKADAATVAAIAGLYLGNADHAAFGKDGAPDEATWGSDPKIASTIRQLEEWIKNA